MKTMRRFVLVLAALLYWPIAALRNAWRSRHGED